MEQKGVVLACVDGISKLLRRQSLRGMKLVHGHGSLGTHRRQRDFTGLDKNQSTLFERSNGAVACARGLHGLA